MDHVTTWSADNRDKVISKTISKDHIPDDYEASQLRALVRIDAGFLGQQAKKALEAAGLD